MRNLSIGFLSIDFSSWRYLNFHLTYFNTFHSRPLLLSCRVFWSDYNKRKTIQTIKEDGREPCSSGYGRRIMFQRSWVQIPTAYTGRTIFTYICGKNCLKRPKKNKRGRCWPIKKQLKKTKEFKLEISGVRRQTTLPTVPHPILGWLDNTLTLSKLDFDCT